MDATEIAGLESELADFLSEFNDCFGRSEPREHLRTYVSGQLSDLERKSVEPMALAADMPPRTLQRFLELVEWDEQRLRDKLQQTIARDHAAPVPAAPRPPCDLQFAGRLQEIRPPSNRATTSLRPRA